MAIITTPRLILSPFQPTDWPFFLRLRENPDIMRFMGTISPIKETRLLFARRLNAPHTFVIRQHHDTTPLGDIGLQISHHFPQEADIGYCIISRAQGKGIASEAVRAVCDYAFEHAGVMAINAWVLADNKGSVRILEKTGFVRTQVLEQAYEVNGVHYDDWGYRLECGKPKAR
ncbi:GNAT family N-acetyltransferase [Citrobacter freundii]|uniref:GNAT family N-acetyltransferase n=1 Tax=Citrobacter freundii TaxID=546 RepID=A0A7W3D7L2_CITFR|nr:MULTISPECIES: GNAT family N-acetyltransferase [Citrobacter]MBA8064507.1 GNAT family N-acetyltransferase [Citrobacter freundii]MCS3463109.1 RimJ/RimL family protein N-acetyltransferase [Citrobacter sp. JUb117]QMF21518.1 GNAT family N-acetyltransferase [Citrobacter freundii]TKU15775.1 GNAT family N-acetyltransferase [Citrobacter sp. wls829]